MPTPNDAASISADVGARRLERERRVFVTHEHAVGRYSQRPAQVPDGEWVEACRVRTGNENRKPRDHRGSERRDADDPKHDDVRDHIEDPEAHRPLVRQHVRIDNVAGGRVSAFAKRRVIVAQERQVGHEPGAPRFEIVHEVPDAARMCGGWSDQNPVRCGKDNAEEHGEKTR